MGLVQDGDAPPGTLWVCPTCGKTHVNRYDIAAEYDKRNARGWDESCAIHAILCLETYLVIRNGRVWEVKEGGVVK